MTLTWQMDNRLQLFVDYLIRDSYQGIIGAGFHLSGLNYRMIERDYEVCIRAQHEAQILFDGYIWKRYLRLGIEPLATMGYDAYDINGIKCWIQESDNSGSFEGRFYHQYDEWWEPDNIIWSDWANEWYLLEKGLRTLDLDRGSYASRGIGGISMEANVAACYVDTIVLKRIYRFLESLSPDSDNKSAHQNS
jgi:hypothetical protein